MKLKTVKVGDKTYAEVDDKGFPVYVVGEGDSAKELGFDAPAAQAKIGGLNRESQTHRESYEAVQAKFEPFKDYKPEDVAKAMQTVGNLSSGELKTAAQVEEIKREAQKVAEQQVQQAAGQSATRIGELEKSIEAVTGQLYNEKVGGAFARSKYAGEKLAIPPDMLRAQFGNNFKIEEGKVVPYDANGNKIWSQVRAGELADFDEGLERLVDAYPYKAQILKGAGHGGGSGAKPANAGGNGAGGKAQMSRQSFEALPQSERAAAVRTHEIVDAA